MGDAPEYYAAVENYGKLGCFAEAGIHLESTTCGWRKCSTISREQKTARALQNQYGGQNVRYFRKDAAANHR